METERLRAALLTSLSHDLKTPLAAILGAASTLRDVSDKLDEELRDELLSTVIDESERLNRFIANLLDMTKLEAGAVAPKPDVHDVSEIVDATLKRAKKILSHHRVQYRSASEIRKFAPIRFCWSRCFSIFWITPPNTRRKARSFKSVRGRISIGSLWRFAMKAGEFHRTILSGSSISSIAPTKVTSVRAGTGLGLPIARGFVEIMGGTITAANRPDASGAVFTISLPAGQESETLDHAA